MNTNDQLTSIIDSFIKAGEVIQIKRRIREKQKQIEELPTKCGTCSIWMTAQCPKEKRIKVSMSMPICDSYKKIFWVDETISKWEAEINQLQESLDAL